MLLDHDVRPSGVAVPSPERRRVVNGLRAARVVLLGAALLTIALLGVAVVDFDPRSPLLRVGLKAVFAVVLVGVALLWWRRNRLSGWAADVAVAAVASYCALALAAALKETPYALGGLGGDAGYRTQAVARFADTWRNVDFSYQDLPAFYPPAMTYVFGRGAWLLDVPHYLAYKYGSILMTFAVAIVAYILWRRILPARVAALVSLTVLVIENAFQTDAWLVLFAIVPWWLEAIHGIRRKGLRPRPGWVQGLIGAAFLVTYYYYFFILGVALLLLPLLERWHPARTRRAWVSRLTILGIAATISSIYWLPFLLSIARAQDPVSLQNFWFSDPDATLPVPMFEVSLAGVVQLIGFAHVAWTARRDRLSGGLLLLVGAGYAWYVLGFLAAAVGTPVLVFRTEQFLVLLLTVAGIRALAAAAVWGMRRWPGPDSRRVVALLTVGAIFFTAQGFTDALVTSGRVDDAHNQPLPSGALPPHADSDAEAEPAPADEVLSIIRNGYAGEGHPVVLTARHDILSLSPVWTFTQWTSHYAHPAGEYRARLRFLRELERTDDPERFAALSADNRFDAIDAVVLRQRDGLLELALADNDFPYGSTTRTYEFERGQFGEAYFAVTELPGWFIAVRR